MIGLQDPDERARWVQSLLARQGFASKASELAREVPQTPTHRREGMPLVLDDLWRMKEVSIPGGRLAIVDIPSLPLRYRALEGELARCALLTREETDPTLILVTVPAYSDRLFTFVRVRMAEWMPNHPWIVLDEHGYARGLLPDTKSGELKLFDQRESQSFERPAPVQVTQPGTTGLPWTEMNVYLAKWLFLAGLRRLWKMSRPAEEGPPRNPADLARMCGVSRASAYRFVDAFSKAGLLRTDAYGIDIRDPAAFLNAWSEHARQSAADSAWHPVQWHHGPVREKSDLHALSDHLDVPGTQGIVAAGFAAADLRGWLRVTPAPLAALHWVSEHGELGAWMSEHSLYPVDNRRDAHFFIIQPANPLGIRRCLGFPVSGPPDHASPRVADPLQIIVDCIGLPRGEEQVDYITDLLEMSRSVTPDWS